MKTAILLHGKPGEDEYYDPGFPSASNSHWFPWLQKQLLINDVATQTPEIPNSWKPDYETWCKEFERYDITPETILVGHSCGGGIVRYLSEHRAVSVGKVVLVAPSLGIDWDDRSFFDFAIDPTLASRTKGLVIFGSDNDSPGVMEATAKLKSKLKDSIYKEFSGYGHFTWGTMKTGKFPELLEAIL